MIKPHEIQIGSIVLRDGVPSVVKWITETHLGGIPLGGFDPREWSYEEIQGIAINHQLAEQLGFEIQDQDDFDTRYDKHIDKKLISLSIEHGGQCWLSIYTPMYDCEIVPCKFIHQLQNAYSLFTGEMLTIKEGGNDA